MLTPRLVLGASLFVGCADASAPPRIVAVPPPSASQTAPSPVEPRVEGNPDDVLDLSLGPRHACALQRKGRMSCWGSNTSGQLGEPIGIAKLTPAVVFEGVEAMATSEALTCAAIKGGSLRCLGKGVPDGDVRDVRTIVMSRNAIRVCTLTTRGTVACFSGQGTHKSRIVPVEGVAHATDVAVSGNFGCALTKTGLVCFDDKGALASAGDRDVRDVVEIANGYEGVCVRTKGGDAWCISAKGVVEGSEKQGVSRIQHAGHMYFPTTDAPLRQTSVPASAIDDLGSLVLSPGGQSLGCVITQARTVKCWGERVEGQLGDGVTNNVPRPVKGPPLGKVKHLLGEVPCAILTSGQAACWVVNSADPLRVANAMDIVGGPSERCGVFADGRVQCWGQPDSATLGVRLPKQNDPVWERSDQSRTLRTPVGLPSASGLAMGESHVCARTTGGQVWCWGQNGVAQLGRGTKGDVEIAAPVRGVAGALEVRAAEYASCSRNAADKVFCWGMHPGLGLADAPPTVIPGLSGGRGIAVSRSFACAIDRAGNVACAGQGRGSGGKDSEPHPAQAIVGATDAVAIAAAEDVACIRTKDRRVACWGDNTRGQLGDGTYVSRSDARVIAGLDNVEDLAIRKDLACALLGDRSLMCWGYNEYNHLQQPNAGRAKEPVPVVLP